MKLMKLDSRRRVGIGVLLCSIFLMLPGTAHASVIVVGDGTPASCTASAFQDALTAAAAPSPDYTIIRFDCGDEPLKIVMPEPRVTIPDRTTIDGGDRITITGGDGFLVGAGSSVKIVRIGFGPTLTAIRLRHARRTGDRLHRQL